MRYTGRIDWQLNKNIRAELVKRYVDVSKLSIFTAKGIVEIRGELNFIMHSGEDLSSLTEKLKILESVLMTVPYVKHIVWRLSNWQRVGNKWLPTKEYEKKLEDTQT
jgi:hypothetical protein